MYQKKNLAFLVVIMDGSGLKSAKKKNIVQTNCHHASTGQYMKNAVRN
jgi:hypothetical protein